MFLLLYNLYGYRKQDSRFVRITTELSLIIILLFIVLSSLSGLYFGFSRSPFSFNYNRIIFNVIVIFFCEFVRYIFSYSNKFLFIFFSLFLLLYDMYSLCKNTDFFSYQFFVQFSTLIIPYILVHLLCIYFCHYGCFIPGFIFRLFYSIYPLILPVYPNYGNYIYSVVNISLPFLLFYFSNRYIKYYYRSKKTYSFKTRIWFLIPLYSLLLFSIILVSGITRYQVLAIGSGSMEPNISYGGVVIFRRFNNDSLYKGDVIVFKHGNSLIVHRIVDINNDVIYTKGDANDKPDSFGVARSDIVGIAKFDVKYIGFPSILINRFFK